MTEQAGKTKNLFRASAAQYDLDDRGVVKGDLPFYLERARGAPGAILELACGTGRVTIPLAEAGHEVWGLDLSREMLAQLELKRNKLPEEVAKRICLIHGDMTSFALARTFSLIIIPFRSFQALTREDQQRACLAKVQQYLMPDGRFIINVFRPYSQLDRSWVQPETLDWEKIDSRTGLKVRRFHVNREIDLESQIIYSDLVYYVANPDGGEDRIVEPLAMKYYYEGQMRALLLSAGFKIVEEMGYYDGRPISGGPELVFVCSKE